MVDIMQGEPKEISPTKQRINDVRSLLNESENRLELLRERLALYLLPEQPPTPETKSVVGTVASVKPADTSIMEDELEGLKEHVRKVIARINEIISRVH